MRYYFLVIGILCILYYLVLAVYSRKLRSTFAVFWVITGGVHLGIGCAPFSAFTYRCLGVACLAAWIVVLFVEWKIIRAMFSRCDEQADWVIVLGAQVRGRRITNSLKRRLDTAAAYLNQYPDAKVIVSGGQGPGEAVTEAAAMALYLEECGIKRDRIHLEDRSTSTRENLRFSGAFADRERDKIVIVTNDFHIYRASVIAKQEGYRNILLLPADSNPVFQLNYLVREFFGVLHVWTFSKRA